MNRYLHYKNRYLELKSEQILKSKKPNVLKTDEGNFISYTVQTVNSIKEEDFTEDVRKPNRDKILKINSVSTFDLFTKKYGGYNKIYKHLYIKWDSVRKDYKGFYLNKSNINLKLRREDKAMLATFQVGSWWSNEYNEFNVNGVMIYV